MRTAQDFLSLTSAIQMDLRAASAKMVELRAWIANLDLPTDEVPYSLELGEEYVRKVGYLYTDSSLAEDLRERGADEAHVTLLLALAARRRGEAGGFITLPGEVTVP